MRQAGLLPPANIHERGPFCAKFKDSSTFVIDNSYLITDATSVASAIPINGGPWNMEDGLNVYLEITFSEGSMTSASLESANGSWWGEYPNTLSYAGDPSLNNQTHLWAPIASVNNTNLSADGPCTPRYTVTRYAHTNLMLMQTCNYFFLIAAPWGPHGTVAGTA